MQQGDGHSCVQDKCGRNAIGMPGHRTTAMASLLGLEVELISAWDDWHNPGQNVSLVHAYDILQDYFDLSFLGTLPLEILVSQACPASPSRYAAYPYWSLVCSGLLP